MARLSVVLLLCLSPVALAAPDGSLVQVARTFPAVVGLDYKFGVLPTVVPRVANATNWGSGTVVRSEGGRSWVLTCRHVCAASRGTFRVWSEGREYAAEFVAADWPPDLALLRVAVALPVAELADSWPEPGEPVYLYGHEGGGPQVGRVGKALKPWTPSLIWTPVGKLPIGPRDFLFTARPEPGASGAAVLDKWGRVAGVVWGKSLSDLTEYGGLAVGPDEVRRFLKRHEGK